MPGKAMLREGRIRLSLRFDVDRQRRRKLHELFVGRYGLRVRGGPFAGMVYPRQAPKWVYNLVPRLLGTYECELHHVFEQVIATGFPTIIDVGAADGYYTVGLALKSPGSTVHAFEPVPGLRRFTKKLATLNGAGSRVEVHPACHVRQLRTLMTDVGTFLKVDCEGCESELLSMESVPNLRNASILVELHDCVDGRPPEWLCSHFATTHRMRLVASRERDPHRHQELRIFEEADAARLILEARVAQMWWALLEPIENEPHTW